MNLPDDPWQLLGLDPATATEREVKRAYARLLKVHRPDTDPEGFKKLHAAYQEALEAVSEGIAAAAGQRAEPEAADLVVEGPQDALPAEKVGAQPAADGPPGMPPVPESAGAEALPEDFRTAAALLREEMRAEPPPLVPPHFRVLRGLVQRTPALAAPWAEVLMGAFSGPAALAVLLDAGDVLLLFDAAVHGLAADIIRAWRSDPYAHTKLRDLAALLLARLENRSGPAHPGAMHYLALQAAFYLPETAEKLADAVFLQLPPQQREQAVGEIEYRAAAGRALSGLSFPELMFWEDRIFTDAEETVDWSVPAYRDALQQLAARREQDWPGWPVISRVVPGPVLEAALWVGNPPHRQEVQAPVVQREQMHQSWQEERTGLERFSPRLAWVGVFIIITVIRLLFSPSGTKPQRPTPDIIQAEQVREHQRLEEDMQRAARFLREQQEHEKAQRERDRGVQPAAGASAPEAEEKEPASPPQETPSRSGPARPSSVNPRLWNGAPPGAGGEPVPR